MKTASRSIKIGNRIVTLSLYKTKNKQWFEFLWYPDEPEEIQPSETRAVLDMRRTLLEEIVNL